MDKALDFEIRANEGEARSATLTTRRAVIETPVFMPVGTAGTVKGIRFESLETDLDARDVVHREVWRLERAGRTRVVRAGQIVSILVQDVNGDVGGCRTSVEDVQVSTAIAAR